MSGNSSSDTDLDFWKQPQCLFTYGTLFIYYILLLPLFIFILYLGYQRWRKQRSGSTSETSSHSDIITYNMVAIELISFSGFCVYCYGMFGNPATFQVGQFFWMFVTPGEYLFHILTCVDRYLAVVHPVTYLRLRQSGGVRIRNVAIGCVWLICFGFMGLVHQSVEGILNIVFMLLSFIAVCFCSLSVLRVLVQPGPGDVSGNRRRVDQSKKRAFQTIMIILAALMLRILSKVVDTAHRVKPPPNNGYDCVMMWSLAWFTVPSSLVLPLLFLHRAGKLPSCKTNTKSG